jgi:death-on-curing protein
MIDIDEVIAIHDRLIDEFGGRKGLRDNGLLESALWRPFHTYEGKDLYTDPIEKACALLDGIVKNHPFVDGNKRIGYFLFRAYLMSENISISASEDERYTAVVNTASGIWNVKELISWTRSKIAKP